MRRERRFAQGVSLPLATTMHLRWEESGGLDAFL
jgi:hypothetical protein